MAIRDMLSPNASVSIDSALIRQCVKGEADAWTQLIRRYERLIYSVARVLCPEEASDIFQQVCMELYSRLGELRDEAALPKWLITVTRRKCYSLIRSKKDSEELEETLVEASNKIDQIEIQHSLELSVAHLPDRCQELIRLLYHEEATYAEISDRLGIPVSSIGPTRARCLEKLKRMLG